MAPSMRSPRHAVGRGGACSCTPLRVVGALLVASTVASLVMLALHPGHPTLLTHRQDLHQGEAFLQPVLTGGGGGSGAARRHATRWAARWADPPSLPTLVDAERGRPYKYPLPAMLNASSMLLRGRDRAAPARPPPFTVTAQATVVAPGKVFVSKTGERGQMPYQHMAMVEVLPDGKLVAVWQASEEGEGRPDQHLRIAYSLDRDGHLWGENAPLELGGGGGGGDAAGGSERRAVWSPVLHFVHDPAGEGRGALWLFYTQSTVHCRAPGGDVMVARMRWPERTWGAPRTILGFAEGAVSPGINKVIANRLTVLSSGAWVLPYWREKGRSCVAVASEQSGHAGVLRSEDGGATWAAHGDVEGPGTWLIEQTVVEVERGRLLMFCRTAVDVLFVVQSLDAGRTWVKASPTALPNPNAKIAAITLPAPAGAGAGEGGAVTADHPTCILLCFNNHPVYPQPHVRTRSQLALALSCSRDAEGKEVHWERLAYLESGKIPGYRHHYPTLVALPRDPSNHNHSADPSRATHRVAVVYSSFFMKRFRKTAPEGIRAVTLDIQLQASRKNA